MIRYFANSAATRKNRPLSTGYDNDKSAKDQAVFLSDTYGGVAIVSTNKGDLIAKYSTAKGWH